MRTDGTNKLAWACTNKHSEFVDMLPFSSQPLYHGRSRKMKLGAWRTVLSAHRQNDLFCSVSEGRIREAQGPGSNPSATQCRPATLPHESCARAPVQTCPSWPPHSTEVRPPASAKMLSPLAGTVRRQGLTAKLGPRQLQPCHHLGKQHIELPMPKKKKDFHGCLRSGRAHESASQSICKQLCWIKWQVIRLDLLSARLLTYALIRLA